jgi:hypothetical protein
MHTQFWSEILKGRRYQSENLGVDGKVILEWMTEVGWQGVDWSYLITDRDKWRAFVNTVMNVGIP